MKLRVWLAGKIVCPRLKFTYHNDSGTYYDNKNKKVTLGLNAWQDECGFLRHLREEHGCKEWNKVNVGVWSLLHEIGHYHTFDYVEDDSFTRAFCAVIPLDVAKEYSKYQDLYFNMESEFEATEWAIEWLHKNPWRSRLVNLLLRKGVK